MNLLVLFLDDLFRAWLNLPFVERAVALILVVESPVIWVFETIRHWRLIKIDKDSNTLSLAPITARGRLLEDLGPGGVAEALRAELFSIREALDRVFGIRPAPYLAPAIGADTGYYLVGLRHETTLPEDVQEVTTQRIEQSVELRVGSISIPISEIIDLLLIVLSAFPVPYREQYRRTLINVSLMQSGDQIRLTVSRDGRKSPVAKSDSGKERFRSSNSAILFTETATARTLEDVSGIIRDAAFMILEMQDHFRGRRWQSMRSLLDGIEALDVYRRTGLTTARDHARQHMRTAAQADPQNLEALYYHATMTMIDRTDGSIEEAIRCFDHALSVRPEQPGKADNLSRLWAMVHLGLAYCYAQQWHRLGNRRHEVLDQAKLHTKMGQDQWESFKKLAGGKIANHPLIPYTWALVTTVNEEKESPHEDRTKRFLKAYDLYREAVNLQPENGMFHNNVGWVLLKLIQWGIKELPKEFRREKETAEIALLAEIFLQKSLGLNPTNKLAHANLCLLYSLAPFVDEADKAGLARSRYHGMRAVDIDSQYINGYRDLAVAFIRYGELKDAYEWYTKALEQAELPDKDREIIRDVATELEKHAKLSDDEMKRWKSPEPRLLMPAKRVQLAGGAV
jgi:tetratricopeptide (TPR) repeat protein